MKNRIVITGDDPFVVRQIKTRLTERPNEFVHAIVHNLATDEQGAYHSGKARKIIIADIDDDLGLVYLAVQVKVNPDQLLVPNSNIPRLWANGSNLDEVLNE